MCITDSETPGYCTDKRSTGDESIHNRGNYVNSPPLQNAREGQTPLGRKPPVNQVQHNQPSPALLSHPTEEKHQSREFGQTESNEHCMRNNKPTISSNEKHLASSSRSPMKTCYESRVCWRQKTALQSILKGYDYDKHIRPQLTTHSNDQFAAQTDQSGTKGVSILIHMLLTGIEQKNDPNLQVVQSVSSNEIHADFAADITTLQKQRADICR